MGSRERSTKAAATNPAMDRATMEGSVPAASSLFSSEPVGMQQAGEHAARAAVRPHHHAGVAGGLRQAGFQQRVRQFRADGAQAIAMR